MKDNSIMLKFVEDLKGFIKEVHEGMGYILRFDILRQFHEHTNYRWAYFIFRPTVIEGYIVDECERMNIHVYEDEEEMMKDHKNDF